MTVVNTDDSVVPYKINKRYKKVKLQYIRCVTVEIKKT